MIFFLLSLLNPPPDLTGIHSYSGRYTVQSSAAVDPIILISKTANAYDITYFRKNKEESYRSILTFDNGRWVEYPIGNHVAKMSYWHWNVKYQKFVILRPRANPVVLYRWWWKYTYYSPPTFTIYQTYDVEYVTLDGIICHRR